MSDTTFEDRIVDVTSALVAIATHEREEQAQALLAEVFDAVGFSCELQEIEPGRPNLIARRGEGGPFLCSHIDVHPPYGHPAPFTCRREGDLLVGRGVLDAKGQIAAIVAAVEAEPDVPALVVITCDEERGGLGSERLAIPDGPWSSQGGIVLEPTAFRICTAQAGHVDVRVEVSGPSSHVYAPDPAGSPITAVLAVIEELDTARFLKARHPLLPDPRLNVGIVRGGEHPWRTPAHALLEATLGVVPPTEIGEAEAEVCSRLDEVARRWEGRGLSLRYEIIERSEPIDIAVDRVPIGAKIANAMGASFEPAGMPAWTDAGNFLVKHDLPCVVFGAGELRTAHSDQESVAVGDLIRLAGVLRTLLTTA